MSPEIAVVVTLLTSALLAALTAWLVRWPDAFTVLTVVLTGAAGGWVATTGPLALPSEHEKVLVFLLIGALAIAGGGPVTVGVFKLVDGPQTGGEGVAKAGEILRGGAWIGGLERAAIVVALLAGWPEGVALALALKGLGRYPELRNQENPGTAERFLIGTFTSVLWAVACAGIALLWAT